MAEVSSSPPQEEQPGSKTIEEEQPDSKRLKLTSPPTADDEKNGESAPTLARKPRYKRRKVAIFFAFCGVGYQGMQKNPDAKTIEGDLEEALYHAGAIPEQDKGQPRRFDWGRSARTDKGVSAVCQVVSGKFYVDPPDFVERLNSHLSPQIRIFGFKRVTASFNAKKFCDRRRYVYLIPVFALDPSSHRGRDSVADLGFENEINNCSECSENGRKVLLIIGKRKTLVEAAENRSGISSNAEKALLESKIENVSSSDTNEISNLDSENTSNIEPARIEDGHESECDANGQEKTEKKSEFRYGEAEKERFNRLLKYYEGTHNFHNFTTRTKAEDPSAKRYILSFNANTLINIDGIDFVKCEVVGQSFMLHQIRKMIGLAIAIMRNQIPESVFETAFEQKVKINVPMVPEVGLYLDECFFTSYNKRWHDSHEELSMKDYVEKAEDFRNKYIHPNVAKAEKEEGAVALWLHSINFHNFRDQRDSDNAPSSGINETDADNCRVSNVEGSSEAANTDK